MEWLRDKAEDLATEVVGGIITNIIWIAVAAVAVGIAFLVWAILQSVSPPFVALAGIFGFGSILWIANQAFALRDRVNPPAQEDTKAQPSGTEVLAASEPSEVKRKLTILFRLTAEDAFNRAWKLLEEVAHEMSYGPRAFDYLSGGAALVQVGGLLRVFVLGGEQKRKLESALGSSAFDDHHVQVLFGDFYDKYLRVAIWIHKAAYSSEVVGLQSKPDYQQWRLADSEFMKRLHELTADPGLVHLYDRYKSLLNVRKLIDEGGGYDWPWGEF